MKLAINPLLTKKVDKELLKEIERQQAWQNIECTPEQAFELITVDGYASTCELVAGRRYQVDYVSRQLFMVDVDNETDKNPVTMTIPELLEHDFYNAYGAGFYATHSFRPEHHKFRILFITEQPVTDAGRARKIIRGLLKIFSAGDEACKDPARLFYGNQNCELKEFTGNVLPADIEQALVDVIDKEDHEFAESMATAPEPSPLTDQQRRKILELLKQTFVGSYPIWRNVGWGMKAGGFALQDFQYVTAGMMNSKTAQDAVKIWNDGKANGRVTMGSVIHLLRERHGQDCLRELNPVTKFLDTAQRLREACAR